MNEWASLALWNTILVVLIAGITLLQRRSVPFKWIFISIALFNLNILLVLDLFSLRDILPAFFNDQNLLFNWFGKSVALLASIVILAFSGINARAAGITLRQARRAWIGWSVLGLLCVTGILIALNIPDEQHSIETIAYQLTMPSLEEEIFYRGLFLFALIRVFGEGPRFAAANFGFAALISTLMFGVIHGLFWTEQGMQASAEAFIFAGGFGALLTWLRLNTGSVVVPILMHSAINTIWRLF